MMELRRFDSADAVAESAAAMVASAARDAIGRRGRFVLALSGGSTPWRMLEHLSARNLAWDRVHVVQVDERQAPAGDPARNLTHILARFIKPAGIPESHCHAMPVDAGSLEEGARQYGATLARLAGSPPVLDLVHLGMGADGHTASLLPGDRLLEEEHSDVGVTPSYHGHRRMSLTLPVINRARRILWLILGEAKAGMLARLIAGDPAIPAGRVCQARATVLTDIAAWHRYSGRQREETEALC